MSNQSIPKIVVLLIRTAFVYNNTNYAVPFMTLQPSSTVCVCVCVNACLHIHAHIHAFICEYMFVYI